tara:strand:+ start:2255 stop:2767 length:513 start_codon:yes stop_codon:yes gene_type:complete
MKIFLVFLFLLSSSFAIAQDKIAYVDFNYILINSLASKSLNDQLNTLNKKNINKFKKIEKDLKVKQDKVLGQKNILNEDEYKKKVNNYQTELNSYKSMVASENKKILDKKTKAQSLLMKNINPILAKYSEENLISIIMDKKNILIGKSELDITKDIIKILDKKIKSIKLN